MIERSVAFGENSGLIGTICAPSEQAAGRPGIGLILFNAGLIHRIGPHRLNVRLARKLASRGIPSLRFDLSGLGDSPRSRGLHGFEAQAVIDLRSAMDTLSSATPAHQFALFGICSGAHHGYAASFADDRVIGLLMYDGYGYQTVKSRLNRYLMRIRERGWGIAVGGWAARGISSLARRLWTGVLAREIDTPGADVEFFIKQPSKPEFAAGLRTLLDRGVKVGLIYSGEGFDDYNYERQFHDAFDGLGVTDRVTAEFLPDLDHVATSIANQAELVRRIESWLMQLVALRQD